METFRSCISFQTSDIFILQNIASYKYVGELLIKKEHFQEMIALLISVTYYTRLCLLLI